MEVISGETLIREGNILLDVEFEDFSDMILSVGNKLMKEGFVKDSYAQAVIEREKTYPTGLDTVCLPVGIPHTDRDHVLESVVTIIRPKKAILFKDMGTGKEDIYAEFIFLLAIKEGKEQVKVLSKLMRIFADEIILLSLKKAKNKQEIKTILIDVLHKGE